MNNTANKNKPTRKLRKRIIGLWIGIAVSVASIVLFGGYFAGAPGMSPAMQLVWKWVFGIVYLPFIALGWLLHLVVGPIGKQPFWLFGLLALTQLGFYPWLGFWIGRRLERRDDAKQ